MKKIIILSMVCGSFLFGQTRDEILKKATEFEKNKDYKNAMIYYKKLANFDKSLHNSIKENFINQNNKGDKNLSQNNVKFHYADLKNNSSQINNNILKSKDKIYPTLHQENSQWVYPYKLNYLGYSYDFNEKQSRKKGEIKFQISLQKPILENILGLDETWSVAYTQNSFWQVSVKSSPFKTNNYEPEIFVTIPSNFWLFDYFKISLNHQSNGKDGVQSRGWNRAYLETSFKIYNLRITPRIWHSFLFDKQNQDIINYIGYGDLMLDYSLGKHHFNALLRNNLKFNKHNKGAFELSWNFPLFNDIYGFIGYFTGYGENLENYNKHSDKIVLGVSIGRY
ncbi:phospholipase A [Campylobacter sp. FMV-PI01]|uniref:Phosphatidylcholine 1-acylhydrolase n=1 Tax=Campylobacter portucalensis TaxID=2608384 RepID=A0A6L5WG72_9BACT|nr:phospholipase A [Campylobacter portucalensis]MSN95929.1 phospholipase A [Campylobacter portucalensis]